MPGQDKVEERLDLQLLMQLLGALVFILLVFGALLLRQYQEVVCKQSVLTNCSCIVATGLAFYRAQLIKQACHFLIFFILGREIWEPFQQADCLAQEESALTRHGRHCGQINQTVTTVKFEKASQISDDDVLGLLPLVLLFNVLLKFVDHPLAFLELLFGSFTPECGREGL